MENILCIQKDKGGFYLLRVSSNAGLEVSEVKEAPNAELVVDKDAGLKLTMESPLVVIDSRTAGAKATIFDTLVSKTLQFCNVKFEYRATQSATSIAEFANELSLTNTPKTVMLMGGDTSVHEFVNGLNQNEVGNEKCKSIRIAVCPTGSGNALATSSGISSVAVALRALLKQQFSKLSVFSVSFNSMQPIYAIAVVSWGFHAALVAKAESMRDYQGKGNRFRAAADKLLETVKQEYKGTVVDVGNQELAGPRLSYLLFTTVQQLEKGFCISPDSRAPSESKLRMVAIPTLDNDAEMGPIMGLAYNSGSHVTHKLVTYKPVNAPISVSVDPQPASMLNWCVDGRIIEVEPGLVQINAPATVCRGWHLQTLRVA